MVPISVNRQYVVMYYKNAESGAPATIVHESKTIDQVSFPARVSIQSNAPKDIAWDYAVIQERYYRED